LAKFPAPPPVATLRAIAPEIKILVAGTRLARIYFAAGPYPSRWNRFRCVGPTAGARWDHHLPGADGRLQPQARAVLYCAPDIDTCTAEVFQLTRRIDRVRNAPHVAVFALAADVPLVDLRGVFATRLGASTAIHSGPRARSRAWARALYVAYPNARGIHYGASMGGHAPAIALNERAEGAMPNQPEFNRALNDDLLVDVLRGIALRIGYGLR
jgi:hypothetical protein